VKSTAADPTTAREATARGRAIGALVGLAVGDAVGTTLEFTSPGSFAPIDDMVGGGPFRLAPGQWTDDTSMAMCLAESILDTGLLDPADQLRRYVAWHRDGYWSSKGTCFDIGNTTMGALRRFEQTGDVTDRQPDEHHAANGSLMRLAGVPIRWHLDVAEAAERSGESSRTTHPASRPVDACRVLGAMTAALIQGTNADEVFAPKFWRYGALDPAVEAVARGSWRSKQPPEIRGSGYSVDALEAALWAVGGAADFRDAVLRAANLGDDADTTAAIAGQLAGTRWGSSGIPRAWREKITAGERITAIASRLFDAATGTPTNTPWPHDPFAHGYWVQPGSVLAGEYPGHIAAERARDKVNLLIDHGIRTFVDLTTPDDGLHPYVELVDDAARFRGLDLQRVALPIPDMDVTDTSGYAAIVDTIRASTDRGGVYVHCWGGIGRTASVVGCLLVSDGLTADAAFDQITQWRSITHKAHQPAPQTKEQREAVRRFARERGQRPVAPSA
jgi:ADP-ribosyl-[dinitrogen reductase] hydrolase